MDRALGDTAEAVIACFTLGVSVDLGDDVLGVQRDYDVEPLHQILQLGRLAIERDLDVFGHIVRVLLHVVRRGHGELAVAGRDDHSFMGFVRAEGWQVHEANQRDGCCAL